MVSVVILAYNRCSEVLITIEKMKMLSTKLPFPLEIVVVDNASADNTTPEVKAKHPDITLVTKPTNNGIAGWNEGFKIAKYKYFLVLDDDSHLESGLIEAVSYLEENEAVGILALNVTTGPYITAEWGWKDGQELFGFFGCAAIIRKAVYDKIGGFADWLHVYAHEWEYGIRCLDVGYKIKYFENSCVIHRASPINRSKKRTGLYAIRNEFSIVYKYFGDDRGKYIFRMWVNMFKILKTGNFGRFFYTILGGIEFMKFRKKLEHTPVSAEAQKFYAENYDGTKPFFGFVKRRISKILSKYTSAPSK